MKAKLAAGEPAFGVSMMFPSPQLVEMLGAFGVDWVLLDCKLGRRGLAAGTRSARYDADASDAHFSMAEYVRAANDDPKAPRVAAAIDDCLARIRAAGKTAGMPSGAENAAEVLGKGMRYVYTHVPRLLAAAAKAYLARPSIQRS